MTTRSPLDLARADYRDMRLYTPDRTPCAIDLSDNTNLWGVPPTAARALRDIDGAAVTRYPPSTRNGSSRRWPGTLACNRTRS